MILSERDRFKSNYRGPIPNDFLEDFTTYRSIKRTVNSYIKNPHKDKVHSIFNKLVILRRSWDDSFLFPEIINNIGEGDLYKTCFLKYIITELFSCELDIEEMDETWEEDVLCLIDEKKIRRITVSEDEVHCYLHALTKSQYQL